MDYAISRCKLLSNPAFEGLCLTCDTSYKTTELGRCHHNHRHQHYQRTIIMNHIHFLQTCCRLPFLFFFSSQIFDSERRSMSRYARTCNCTSMNSDHKHSTLTLLDQLIHLLLSLLGKLIVNQEFHEIFISSYILVFSFFSLSLSLWLQHGERCTYHWLDHSSLERMPQVLHVCEPPLVLDANTSFDVLHSILNESSQLSRNNERLRSTATVKTAKV